MSNLNAALTYHGYGFNVVPCDNTRWEPLKKEEEALVQEGKTVKRSKAGYFYGIQRKDYATKRIPRETVIEWWTKWPGADIAILTGKISGITVIDTEKEADLTVFGLDASTTVRSRSGGGGLHFYFAYNDKIGNSAKKIAPYHDIRNDGGIIYAPPSRHPSGDTYKWIVTPDAGDFLPVPQSVLEVENKQKQPIPHDWEDIIRHPPEHGSRNQDQAVLVGKLLSTMKVSNSDEWDRTLWPFVLQWNDGCSPPQSESALRATYESIKRAELTRRASSAEIGEPAVNKRGDEIIVSIPLKDGSAIFSFSDPSRSGRETEALVRSRIEIPNHAVRPLTLRMKMMSTSSRGGYADQLKKSFGKDINWDLILSTACEAFLDGLNSQVLSDIITADKIVPTQASFLLEPFIEKGVPNLLYAMGGMGKSYLAARMMASLLNVVPMFGKAPIEPARILYLDYENSFSAIRSRMDQIEPFCPGYKRENLSNLFCRECTGEPLSEIKEYLRDYVNENRINLLIVDPIQTALGGTAIDDEVATNYANALRFIGVTSLSIAHIAKGSVGDSAFGSIFFHNLSRNAWFLEGDAEEDSDTKHLVLKHKKHNNTRRHGDIAFRMVNTGIGTDFIEEDIMVAAPERASVKRQIVALLEERSMGWTFKDICARLPSIDKRTIEVTLNRLKNRGEVYHDSETHFYTQQK
jgi:hypothetical protein